MGMDFETKIFPRTGGFGPYNRSVAVFSWISNFAVVLSLFSEVFFTLKPVSYHCRPDPSLLPSETLNLSDQELLNVSIPWVKGSGLSHCELYKYPANFSNFTINFPKETVQCTQGWEYTTGAGLETNIVTQWDLVCQNYWKIPLEQICYMTGWMSGYIVLGSACDRLGRRGIFLGSVLLSGLLGVGVSLSLNPIMFLFLRLSQGAALAGVFLSTYVARLELCDPPHRLMITMIGGLFAVCGELLLPGLAVLCRDWQIMQVVVTVSLCLLLNYWWCTSVFPESPRWLLATQQIHRAKSVLQSFSLRNGVCLSDDIYNSENLLSEIDSVYADDCEPRFHNVCEMVGTRVIWKNSLILAFTVFIGRGIQYCFTQNLLDFHPHFYVRYYMRVLSGGLACVLLCVSVNRFGRRGILLLASILTGMASLLLLALTQYLKDGFVLVLSIVGLLASQAVAMLSVFFASEVLPTVVRGGGLGLILASSCMGKAASSVMELHNNQGYFLHHVVFASFAVLSVLCVMLLPESKRKPLPDSLKEGENLRRPPLFLSHRNHDHLPLLEHQLGAASEYNPENYSRLVSATKKMLARDFELSSPLTLEPLLNGSRAQGGMKNEDSS
ncbi:putative solute carrier family 22 member 31 [Polyodon spathula]|nr:putative solute carrier family 22 member 31 [Polyodon spathula]